MGTHREGMEPLVHYWVPSIATSGLLIYNGDRFPEWRGSMFVGGLAGQQLARLTLDGRTVTDEETRVRRRDRIRDVRQGPDDLIWIVVCGLVHDGFEGLDERGQCITSRVRGTRGRHHSGPQLDDDLLGNVGRLRGV